MLSLLKKLASSKKDRIYEGRTEHLKQFRLSANIGDNTTRLLDIMNNSFDIKTRTFKIGRTNTRAAVIYISELVNDFIINNNIIKSLILESTFVTDKNGKVDLDLIKDSMLSLAEVKEAETFDEIVLGIMSGDTFLCIQGFAKGLLISARQYKGRTVGQPNLEPSVKGPQEAFVEMLSVNLGLIRRRIRDPNLTFEIHKLGRRTKADVVLMYIKGIAHKDLIDKIREKLLAIDIDRVTTAVEVSKLMIDKPNSIFPLVQVTERPDRVVAAMNEGRVAMIIEGAPDGIIIPVTLPILMQSPDDYFESWLAASVIRITRYVCFFISILFPAIYISTTSFHPGMLPTRLVLSITASRTGVPFPAVLEALLMEFTLEILQEAGIRLPRVVGQTVSIVGGLVIGQAAVQAGVVSPIMVIVISITALSSFAIPDYSLSMASRIIRIPFILLAVTFGSFGIAMGLLFLLAYFSSLKSFGLSYLTPVAPFRPRDSRDALIRGPLWSMHRRPEFLRPEDTQRQAPTGRSKPNES